MKYSKKKIRQMGEEFVNAAALLLLTGRGNSFDTINFPGGRIYHLTNLSRPSHILVVLKMGGTKSFAYEDIPTKGRQWVEKWLAA